jgi:hypothetical protein
MMGGRKFLCITHGAQLTYIRFLPTVHGCWEGKQRSNGEPAGRRHRQSAIKSTIINHCGQRESCGTDWATTHIAFAAGYEFTSNSVNYRLDGGHITSTSGSANVIGHDDAQERLAIVEETSMESTLAGGVIGAATLSVTCLQEIRLDGISLPYDIVMYVLNSLPASFLVGGTSHNRWIVRKCFREFRGESVVG